MSAFVFASHDHFWLLYGAIAGFVAFVVLVETWIAKRKQYRAAKLDEIPQYTDYYNVSEVKKPLYFEDGGCTVNSEEIKTSLEQARINFGKSRLMDTTRINHINGKVIHARIKRRKLVRKKSTKRKKK